MANKDYTDSFLDDLEREKVQQFNMDDVMREAVKKVLLAGLYQNGTLAKRKPAQPLRNAALGLVSDRGNHTNEEIGADLRAMWEGLNAVEAAFNEMSKYKPEPPVQKVINKAR